jgi:hypothetical protein
MINPTGIALFMKLSGTISGGRGVRWLRIPERKDTSFASILGLQGIGSRPLRITSTAVKDPPVRSAAGARHASARLAR